MQTGINPFQTTVMARLEQITALVLAAGLAIPSYWFFWSMAGGGGYEKREIKTIPPLTEIKESKQSP